MGLNRSSLHLFLLFVFTSFCVASPSHISYEILELGAHVGRSLLQQKTSCNVDFEHMNYTVITSQCKGPNYTPERCCPPLKQLLCPVKDQVNDLKSNCADTFFSYVNLYGKYPPGLFASLCREGQEGLSCEGVEQHGERVARATALRVNSALASSSLFFGILIVFMYHV